MTSANEPANSKITTDKYLEIVNSIGITDKVSEVIIEDAGLQGEGFASITQCVTVKFEDPQKEPLNFFVKIQPELQSQRELLNEVKAFEKESRFLVDYVGAAEEMCRMKGRPGFIDFYPKCYYGDEDMIVQENLVLGKGYCMESIQELQDLESTKFGVKTLAKHHAIGHIMIQENGCPDKFFQRFPHLDLEHVDLPLVIPTMEPTFENTITSHIKILEKNDIKGAKETISILNSFKGKTMGIVVDGAKTRDEGAFLVLGHGDYWNNNMMFLKDKETGKVKHHVAIDFQGTRYNSPGVDLGYYFFTSVKPHIRRNHLRELLELYRVTLNGVTTEFGHPTNLKFEDIFMDYRKKVGYGFWFGLSMAVGPGITLFKEMGYEDLKDWGDVMESLISGWVVRNPDKGVETAEEIVDVVREYMELRV